MWKECTRAVRDMDSMTPAVQQCAKEWLQKYANIYYKQLEKPALIYNKKQTWNVKMAIPHNEDENKLTEYLKERIDDGT